jgi:hypothetical protein
MPIPTPVPTRLIHIGGRQILHQPAFLRQVDEQVDPFRSPELKKNTPKKELQNDKSHANWPLKA